MNKIVISQLNIFLASYSALMRKKISKKLTKHQYAQLVKKLGEIGLNLDELIVAMPEKIDLHLLKLRDVQISKVIKAKFKGLYSKSARAQLKSAIDILGIRICPYCNRNFIYNSQEYQTCEFDHFHNKDENPLLAISFFNLVPCCPNCNKFKSTRKIKLNPYNDKIFWDDHFKFIFEIKTAEVERVEDFDINILPLTSEFKEHVNVFKLKDLYSSHYPEVLEILVRKNLVTNSYAKELFERFGISIDMLLDEIIWGKAIKIENSNRVALATMTRFLHQIIEKK